MLSDRHYSYPLQTWLKMCKGNCLKIVPFDQIEEIRKPRDFKEMWRYYLSDTRFPCILYKEPDHKYILIDGCHRIKKQMDNNETTGIFFVITPKMLTANTQMSYE